MPKSRLVRPMKCLHEPVAARTRLSMGSPMHRVDPVQYPLKWLPFIGKYLTPRRNASACFEGDESVSMMRNEMGEGRCPYHSFPNAAQRPRVESRSRKKPSSGRKSKKLTKPWRKIESSYIQRVKIHEDGSGKDQKQGSRRMRRRRAPKTSRRLRKDAMSKARRRGRARSYSRRVRTSTRHNRTRKRNYRRLNRNRSRKRRMQRRKRIYRRRRSSDASERRRIFIKPGPRISRERAHIRAEMKNPKGNHEDNDKMDNPLDVKNICRSLVKSLHGIPADCRDVKTSQKKERPESKRGKKRKESHKKKHKHRHIRDKAQRKQHGKRSSHKRRKDLLASARKRAGQRTRAAVRRGRLGVQTAGRRGRHGCNKNVVRRYQTRHQAAGRRAHGAEVIMRDGQAIHLAVKRGYAKATACQRRQRRCKNDEYAVHAASRGHGRHQSCAWQQHRCQHHHHHHHSSSSSHRRMHQGGARFQWSKAEKDSNNNGGDLRGAEKNDDTGDEIKDREKNINDDDLRGAEENSNNNSNSNYNNNCSQLLVACVGVDARPALGCEYQINVENVGDQHRRRYPRRFIA